MTGTILRVIEIDTAHLDGPNGAGSELSKLRLPTPMGVGRRLQAACGHLGIQTLGDETYNAAEAAWALTETGEYLARSVTYAVRKGDWSFEEVAALALIEARFWWSVSPRLQLTYPGWDTRVRQLLQLVKDDAFSAERDPATPLEEVQYMVCSGAPKYALGTLIGTLRIVLTNGERPAGGGTVPMRTDVKALGAALRNRPPAHQFR